MSNYEIIYDNQKSSKRHLPSSDFSFTESGFFNHIREALEFRLLPELIARELTFFFICFGICMYVGFTEKLTNHEAFNYYVLVLPAFVAIFQLVKASFVSMIPGLICLIFGFFMKYFGVHMTQLSFIEPQAIGYFIGLGFLILPLSFFRSF